MAINEIQLKAIHRRKYAASALSSQKAVCNERKKIICSISNGDINLYVKY
jgi:hypothetical protein